MDTSLSALFAAQAGLATTGHNIANANTPGYSRQLVQFAARRPDMTAVGAIGRGVEVEGVRRIQDEFILNNLRSQTARGESYAAVDSALSEVESILGSIDNDHLGDALTRFFGAWNALAQPTITDSLKENVVTSAVSLVTDLHSIDESLTALETNIESSIQLEIGNLNRLLTQVADLNRQIMSAEAGGQEANDLRDQRDLLITQVSSIAEVSTYEREDGTKDVILAGRTMVARDSVTLFESAYEKSADGYRMTIVTNGSKQAVRLSLGKLEGLMTSRDVHITNVRAQLDGVARKLIEDVNALHTQGRTLSGSGLQFFTGDNMHTIGVNQELMDNSGLVAIGRTTAPGDNELALAIANLGNVSSGIGGDDTVNDVYRSLLTELASNRSTYEFMVVNQQDVVVALESKLASIAGVSLDEEGAAMVRYQNSYNAAAKIVATVQEMYDTLMNMV
ncbi:MAG: flagellar hook-associated protein FlgK [bacterium]|nr:flagellar hook-associated protein FlgK [bacterium]MBK9775200.1 flagellar hook-associated protein FlgK [bacterium]